MQGSHPDIQTFLVLGSGEANWEGERCGRGMEKMHFEN